VDPLTIGILVVLFIGNVVLAFVVGNEAEKKGLSFNAYTALAFFFGFPIGIVVLLLTPAKVVGQAAQVNTPERVQCPFCAEDILAQAKVCKHCGRDV
jgi:hypothetical protein